LSHFVNQLIEFKPFQHQEEGIERFKTIKLFLISNFDKISRIKIVWVFEEDRKQIFNHFYHQDSVVSLSSHSCMTASYVLSIEIRSEKSLST
jgi:uncharacterized protein (DUF2225 family)